MKHQASRILHAYWDKLRGERVAPERSEIDPVAIREILPDTFICEVDNATDHPFRLAGTRLCALFGRELKGHGLSTLWRAGPALPAAPEAQALVDTVLAEARGLVAGLRARSHSGKELDLELLLLPLRHGGRTHSRLLGCVSPSAPFPWMGLDPIEELSLTSVRVLRSPVEELDDVVFLPARPTPCTPIERRSRFTVHAGGKNPVDRRGGPSS